MKQAQRISDEYLEELMHLGQLDFVFAPDGKPYHLTPTQQNNLDVFGWGSIWYYTNGCFK